MKYSIYKQEAETCNGVFWPIMETAPGHTHSPRQFRATGPEEALAFWLRLDPTHPPADPATFLVKCEDDEGGGIVLFQYEPPKVPVGTVQRVNHFLHRI